MPIKYKPKGLSILPEIPAFLEGNYLRESHESWCIDSPEKTLQDYVATGLFSSTKRTTSTLIKATNLFFDLDLKDLLHRSESFVEYAKGCAPFYKKGELTEPSNSLQSVENGLSLLSEDAIIEIIQKDAMPLIEKYLFTFFGEPSLIVYSGHGVHVHYHIDENEGYVSEIEGLDIKANREEWKGKLNAFFKYVKSEEGWNVFDTACKDIGTRLCREIGSSHTKAETRPKVVRALTTSDRAICLDEVKEIPSPLAKKVASVNKKQRGRPRKIKAKKVNYDEHVQYQINGEDKTVQVSEFFSRFDEILEGQNDSSKKEQGKIQCRLVEASGSAGSLKYVAYRNAEKGGLTFWCNAPNQLDYDTMNDDTAHWDPDGTKAYWWFNGVSLDLTYDKFGRVLKNLTNLQKIFKCDDRVKGKLRFNSRLKQIYVHRDIHLEAYGGVKAEIRRARAQEWFKITDDHYMVFEMILNTPYGINTVEEKVIRKALAMTVKTEEELSFDPVAEYIESKEWDRERRLEYWLPRCLNMEGGHENYPLYSAYGRAMMLAIARMIYIGSTYCDVQHTLLIAGAQGVGKSTFASIIGLTEVIGDDYFHDSGIDMGTNAHKGDQIQALRGCFLIELPEAISLNNMSTNQSIKAFLTQRKMRGREAYSANQTEEIRATYFITNSNDHLFLSDPTGNRRFLVVNCFDDLLTDHGLIDIEYLRNNIQQLYAEAKVRAVDGTHIFGESRFYEGTKVEQWNLSLSEQKLQKEHNFRFTKPDLVAEELRIILDEVEEKEDDPKIKYKFIIDKLTERLPNYKIGNNSFATHMGRLGWEKFKTRKGIFWRPKTKVKSRPVSQVPTQPPPPKKVKAPPKKSKAELDFVSALKKVRDPIWMDSLFAETRETIEKVYQTFENKDEIQTAQKKLLIKLVGEANE